MYIVFNALLLLMVIFHKNVHERKMSVTSRLDLS